MRKNGHCCYIVITSILLGKSTIFNINIIYKKNNKFTLPSSLFFLSFIFSRELTMTRTNIYIYIQSFSCHLACKFQLRAYTNTYTLCPPDFELKQHQYSLKMANVCFIFIFIYFIFLVQANVFIHVQLKRAKLLSTTLYYSTNYQTYSI